MNKAESNRVINRWIFRYLFGVANLSSILAFLVGYFSPALSAPLVLIASVFGMHDFLLGRISGVEFHVAAYYFWVAFCIMIPVNVFRLHRIGVSEKVPTALNEIVRFNLKFGLWDAKKYPFKAGRIYLGSMAGLLAILFFFHLMTAHEVSFCRGCETASPIGFLVINWGMLNMLLVGVYFTTCFSIFWKVNFAIKER